MNKEALKNMVIDQQVKIINELAEKIETTHSMVDIDESDTLDPEDFSHQHESGEIEQLMLTQLQKAKMDLEALRGIDFSAKSSVEPGAVVITEKFNFLIGFPSIPFDFDGLHLVGVSKASPIYPFMTGKRSGESFKFGDKTYTITEIY
jgi:hypothetical protein